MGLIRVMKAKLVTYTTENLTNSERSILSKKLYGYLDKSNRSRYTYKREGIIQPFKHLKVSKNTFIIELKGWKKIEETLRKSKATIKIWNINIKL